MQPGKKTPGHAVRFGEHSGRDWMWRAMSIPRWRRFFPRIAWEFNRHILGRSRVTCRLGPKLRITLRTNDLIGQVIFVRGCFEPGVARAITNLARPGDTVLDIGANIGQMTLVAATAVGDTGQIHAFEPYPPVFAELSANVKLNGARNVRLNQLGLADRTGGVDMSAYAPGREGFNTLGRPLRPEGGSSKTIQIPVTTLDSYLLEEGIERVDVIKLDVEGSELAVLKGGEDTLQEHGPTLIFECQPINALSCGWRLEEMWHLLSAFGYTVFGIYPYGPGLLPLDGASDFEAHCAVAENFVALTGRGSRPDLGDDSTAISQREGS